ncbi:MAG: ACT domain-containing protein [Clostridia bacterium]|nr:ACT domain-containing protein [Clostridia bacterium]
MLLKQLSVFLENKPGQLSEFVSVLAQNNIDLRALSIAEAQDYGVLRIIVDKPEQTQALLRAQDWICTVTDVLAVTVPDEPGSLTKLLQTLADKGISLAYTYAFLSGTAGKACIVLRVDDNAYAEKLLKDAGVLC